MNTSYLSNQSYTGLGKARATTINHLVANRGFASPALVNQKKNSFEVGDVIIPDKTAQGSPGVKTETALKSYPYFMLIGG